MTFRMASVRIIALSAFIAAASAAAFADGLDRSAQAGPVAGVAAPTNLGEASSATIDFKVSLDTHSVPLLFTASTDALLSDGGEVAVTASRWTGSRGGHHVSGVLSFPAGSLRASRELVLSLRIAGQPVPLKFEWDDLQRAARN